MRLPNFPCVLLGTDEPGQCRVVVLDPDVDAVRSRHSGVANEFAFLDPVVRVDALVGLQLTDAVAETAGEID